MIHHVELHVSDLSRSVELWGWLLPKLGFRQHQSWPEGRSWISGETYVVLVQVEERFRGAGYHRCRVGLNHLAFHASSREQVDRLTAQLRERGVTILYEDRHPHTGSPESYAVFFEDPDRIKVELVAPKTTATLDGTALSRIAMFASAASRFSALLEATSGAVSNETLTELARDLSSLCSLALDLPEVEPTDREHEEKAAPRVRILVGENDHYREVFDAFSEDAPVTGSLEDDLGDIHADLRRGLDIFQCGTEDDARDAAWEWRFHFFAHWGEHATSALRALYWLLRRVSEQGTRADEAPRSAPG